MELEKDCTYLIKDNNIMHPGVYEILVYDISETCYDIFHLDGRSRTGRNWVEKEKFYKNYTILEKL